MSMNFSPRGVVDENGIEPLNLYYQIIIFIRASCAKRVQMYNTFLILQGFLKNISKKIKSVVLASKTQG